jgi:hypothetical protein
LSAICTPAEAHYRMTEDVAQTEDRASSPKLTNWEKEPTLQELKNDLLESDSYHQTHMSQVETWLDNLHVRGKAKPKTTGKRSSAQPKLIRKQAEWRYAALSEPFLSRPDVFNVKPVSWEDVEASRQNRLILNNQFNTQIDKEEFIDEYVRAATDEGTVIVKVGWEFDEEEYEAEVPDVRYVVNPEFAQTIEYIALLRDENPAAFAQLAEPLREAYELSLDEGVPVQPIPQGMKTETRTRTLYNRPTLEVCELANVHVDPTCKGRIEKAGFVIHHFESSLSILEKDGRYKNLDKINVDANSILGEPDHADSDEDAKSFNFRDKPRTKFVVYEYWGYRDLDGSGLVRPFVAAWVGDTLIRMEENPFPDKGLPFVLVQYLPVRKHIYGEPDGALLEDNQKIAGAVTRGMIDSMGRSANGQQGIRKDALDAVNRRKFEEGLDYQFNANIPDPRTAIHMHQYPEIPASAQFMLELQNMEAESMTGVKAFSGGLSGDALGDVATGVRGVLDAASKRELGILRRLSKGLIKIGRKVIAMNAEFLSDEEVVRVTNEDFVQVRRDDLAGNFDLRLSISTAEEDEAQARELAFMLQTLGPDIDPKLRQKMLAEICRLRKMPDFAKELEEYEPQPDPMQQEIQMLTIEELRKKIRKLDSEAVENYAGAQLDQAKALEAQAKAEHLQSDTDLNNLNFVEQETGVTQERELQKHSAQAKAQAALKLIEHQLDRAAEKFQAA